MRAQHRVGTLFKKSQYRRDVYTPRGNRSETPYIPVSHTAEMIFYPKKHVCSRWKDYLIPAVYGKVTHLTDTSIWCQRLPRILSRRGPRKSCRDNDNCAAELTKDTARSRDNQTIMSLYEKSVFTFSRAKDIL